MGYIRHNAIVVTGNYSDETFYNTTQKAHDKAVELGLLVTDIVGGVANGYSSFMICPDGSKEGWPISEGFDCSRKEWIKWAKTQLINFVHLSYGGDDSDIVTILDSN